jgi:hypothetical protein
MWFPYGDNKSSKVKSRTTFDAIINGERTSTTRYSSSKAYNFWTRMLPGTIVKFRSTKEAN